MKNLIDSRLVKKFHALYCAIVETVLFTEPNKSHSFSQHLVLENVPLNFPPKS